MIDFQAELKKFQPVLRVDDANAAANASESEDLLEILRLVIQDQSKA